MTKEKEIETFRYPKDEFWYEKGKQDQLEELTQKIKGEK